MRAFKAFLFLCYPILASACGIVRVSCNFLDEKASTIFVGTVVSPEDPETQVIRHESPIVFKVTERLRGQIGQQVEVYEPGTSCDFAFHAAQSYLVFAYSENGRLTTSELSSTRPAATAGALIRQLRTLNEGRRPASLFGILLQHSGPNTSQPLANTKIRAFSAAGTSTTLTRSDGSFEFFKLTPGPYRVDAELPRGFVRVEVHGLVKAGESCDVESLWTTANGRIRGRVVNSTMKPERGFISVFPAGGDERTSLMGYEVGKHGNFDFGPLPPGRYRLIFRAKAIGRKPFYFPGNSSEQDAAAIDLAEGQHVAVIFVLH